MIERPAPDGWNVVRDRLHAQGLRWTPQRRTLVEVLSRTSGHVTGAELVDRCRALDPATISVPAGPVTFRVRNTGSVEHEFEIFEGDAVVDEVEGLVPGLVKDLTVTLEAGEYTYVCKLAGHEEAGMTGALTVTGG